jgi:hypothetical protein
MATHEIVTSKDQMIERLNEKLGALVKRGEAINVTDQASDVLAKQYKVEIRSYEKAVDLYADGDIYEVKERLTNLQTAKKMLLAPALAVLELVEKSRKKWEEEERKKAEADERREQERVRLETEAKARDERKRVEALAEAERREKSRLAEEARKSGEIGKREAERIKKEADAEAVRQRAAAAEEEKRQAADVPRVEVKPSITAVAGTQSLRNWKFEVTDASLLRRQYLMQNDVEIGRMVRGTQDKAKAEAECPGIRVWSE